MSDDKQTKIEIRHGGSTIEFVEPNAISEMEVTLNSERNNITKA